MKAIRVDAGRYAWCCSQAIWLMGPPAAQWIEDLRGALDAGQLGLVRHVTQKLGEDCAIMLALTTSYEKPLPTRNMRAAWALERLDGHPLQAECWDLIRGAADIEADPGRLIDRCERLQDEMRRLVGDVPNPLTPEGYFPALSMARDWMQFVQAVGQEGFFPQDWTRK